MLLELVAFIVVAKYLPLDIVDIGTVKNNAIAIVAYLSKESSQSKSQQNRNNGLAEICV